MAKPLRRKWRRISGPCRPYDYRAPGFNPREQHSRLRTPNPPINSRGGSWRAQLLHAMHPDPDAVPSSPLQQVSRASIPCLAQTSEASREGPRSHSIAHHLSAQPSQNPKLLPGLQSLPITRLILSDPSPQEMVICPKQNVHFLNDVVPVMNRYADIAVRCVPDGTPSNGATNTVLPTVGTLRHA